MWRDTNGTVAFVRGTEAGVAGAEALEGESEGPWARPGNLASTLEAVRSIEGVSNQEAIQANCHLRRT